MKPRIVVLGSSNTDMTVRLDRLPRAGETLLGGEFSLAAGGKGANQAVAAARAGGAVSFVARVGNDVFGDQALAAFRRDGIQVDTVFRDRDAPSGVALIFVDRKGQNSIAVAGGANTKLTARDVARARPALATASSLVMQLETPLPTVIAAAEAAHAFGTRIILNPAPATELPARLLRLVSILTPNEIEAETLTGIRVTDDASAERAARLLLKRNVATVILTLGARGAFALSSDVCSRVKGFKVKPTDTVAAGDVFNGALAVALGEGQSLLDAVRFANAAGALSVTRHGAQPSAPHRREIERLLKQG